MTSITEEQVTTALRAIIDPEQHRDIVDLGMVSGLVVRDGNVGFAIEVVPERGAALEPLRKAAEDHVLALPGVVSVTAVLTAHRKTATTREDRSPARQAPPRQAAPGKPEIPGIGAIIAVASGKGGVGKSTTAVNLALAFAADGRRVGVLDADVYGPSMPRMLGIHGRPTAAEGNKLVPMENYGIKVMSMGFLVEEDTPMIWRGPMVMGALEQMLHEVLWGALDVLVVDLPPGTGDAQLTMAQRVPLAGAVIVSTPQDIALLDARKGLNMFRKVDVPVLGIIENMSYFVCPHCGERSEIFSHGGAHREAERLGVDFLGEIPLDPVIRETSDSGQPIVVSRPDSPHAQAYRAIAAQLTEKLARAEAADAQAGPRIVIQ